MASIAEGEVTALALCWRIERADGAGLALTSHDGRVTSAETVHQPEPGIMPSAVTRSLGLEPHSSEVAGAMSSDALDEADLAMGRWDGAAVTLDAADWSDAAGSPIRLLAGELGEVALDGAAFSAELKGAAAKLQAPVCPSTSPECRAQLGDKDCRVDLAGRTMVATVESHGDGLILLDRALDERYVFGRIRYLSGQNCGRATTILSVSGNAIRVRDLPRAPVEPGCRVGLREGCDKMLSTCAARFDNAANFRGEPHLPGNDLLTRYPGA